MCLAIQTSMKRADAIRKAPEAVKVSSANGIEHIVRQQLPGLQLTYSDAPPGFSAAKPTTAYFAIQQSGHDWDGICRARNFGAFVPSEFSDVQLELIVVLPDPR